MAGARKRVDNLKSLFLIGHASITLYRVGKLIVERIKKNLFFCNYKNTARMALLLCHPKSK